MGTGLDFARKELKKLEQLYQELEESHELFENEHLSRLSFSIESLRKRILQNEEKDRVLRIGIVGDVKAGKSSFLNAAIFHGKDLLPKAATPMTAALTRIGYNEEDRSEAIIHFYPREDWNKIKADAREYDRRIDEEYAQYSRYIEEKAKNPKNRKTAEQVLTKEEFEKKYKSRMPNDLCVAKELAGMHCSGDAETKLGTSELISVDAENLTTGLADYVGAHGKYTPIVSYVELKMHNPELAGVEIIDTPGLNDPILSRCAVTKKFLGECNVAILLSPCSHFMDESTVNLMLRRLPSNNIAVIQVIGSQIDFGMMDYRGKKCDIAVAYEKTVDNCKSRLRDNLEKAKRNLPPSSALVSLEKNEPLFVSAMCYSIAVKLEQGIQLSEEESKTLDILRGFEGFEDGDLMDISGANEIQTCLDGIRRDKAATLAEDSRTFLRGCLNNIAGCLEDIRIDADKNKNTLEKFNIGDLRKKHKALQRSLDSSRKRIKEKFELAALDAERNGRDIETDIVLVQQNHSDITIDKNVREDVDTYRTGLFGWKKETVVTHTTIRSASSSEVIRNITTYASACLKKVNEHFNSGLVDEEKLKTELKNIAIDAIGDDENCSAEDILAPVNIVLGKIKIPHVEITVDEYVDEVNNRFPNGNAVGDDIHKLSALQQTIFTQIAENVKGKVEQTITDIQDLMKTNAASFVDEVEKKLSGNFTEIEKQIEEKDHYLAKYQEFISKIAEYKQRLRG